MPLWTPSYPQRIVEGIVEPILTDILMPKCEKLLYVMEGSDEYLHAGR